MNTPRTACLLALSSVLFLAAPVLAQSVERALSLVVAGQVASTKAIVVRGQTYVPLSALTTLGVKSSITGSTLTLSAASPSIATATTGGANQRSATEGCQGETLFNGVWRVKVLGVDSIVRDPSSSIPGWAVRLELRNGSQKDISPLVSFDTFGKGVYLVGADGAQTGNISGDGFYYTFDKTVPPGGVLQGQVRFISDAPESGWEAFKAAKPAKFILSVLNVGNAKQYGVAYSTPTPSFRVDLTCQK